MEQKSKHIGSDRIAYLISLVISFIISAFGFYLISGLSRFDISALMDFDKVMITFITLLATFYWLGGVIGGFTTDDARDE